MKLVSRLSTQRRFGIYRSDGSYSLMANEMKRPDLFVRCTSTQIKATKLNYPGARARAILRFYQNEMVIEC